MTLLLVESEKELQRVIDQFHNVCNRRKLRVNVGKSKVMVFERREIEVVDFRNPYRVSVPVDERCEIVMNCGVVEWVKRNTLGWFGHIERKGSEEFVKKVYMSESVGPNSRGRPAGRWRDRVKEYMCERGATKGGGRAGSSKEGVLGQGEVETFLPWPSPWGTLPEGAIDR